MTTNEDFNALLGAVVRSHIDAAKITQVSVAEQTGIHYLTLSRRLAGDSGFNGDELHRIAAVLPSVERGSDLMAEAEAALDAGVRPARALVGATT